MIPASSDSLSTVHRYPDFLGIGVQKAGTTWLHANIACHPRIWLPPIKELQYFNDIYIPGHRKWTGQHRKTHGEKALKAYLARVPAGERDARYIKTISELITGPLSDDWYGQMFDLSPADRLCGEITPEYSLLPDEGIRHVVRLSPSVKIILVLRDPIDRNWSHIRMLAHNQRADGLDELKRIACYAEVIKRANYPAIINKWTSHVARQNFAILFLDDIERSPLQTLRELCNFLSVEYRDEYFPRAMAPVHIGRPTDIPADVHDLLKQQLRPIYEEMAKTYPEITKIWRRRHF